MSVTAPTFQAETTAVVVPIAAPADRSAETMQRLRQPFQAQPDHQERAAGAGDRLS